MREAGSEGSTSAFTVYSYLGCETKVKITFVSQALKIQTNTQKIKNTV